MSQGPLYSYIRVRPLTGICLSPPFFPIIDAYKDWVLGPLQNKVVIPYVSMHESTKQMVDYLVSALVDKGVGVEQFNLAVTDIGKLAIP